ncbi:MAG TPA: glycosyltransferase family 2 protein [Flavobacteriales bacterium]|nr:glycosyltransferase family 2 protein [Flavobacteriales bacterium]
MNLPVVSIITPSFQQAAFLPECIASVGTQDRSITEHIIVDGGSTDGSVHIIEQNEKNLKWWCSEKDRGQSHAINKGLEHASGKVFSWINSDDALLPGALHIVSEAFAQDPDLLIFEGIRMVRQKDGTGEPLPLDILSQTDALYHSPKINQQSTFYALDKVKEIGGVDEALKYVMDHELWLQFLFRYGIEHLRIEPVRLAMFRMHEDAKTATAPEAFVDEMAGVLHGLCCAVELLDLAQILSVGHELPNGLRGIPVSMMEQDRISRMVIHFLLKWNRVIHSERRFNAMRLFLSTRFVHTITLNAEQQERLKVIADQVSAGSWLAFRAKRKWQHLWG